MKSIEILKLCSLVCIYGSYLTFLWIFFTAYFNGYVATININAFYEANLEAFLLIVTFPLSIVVFFEYIDFKKMESIKWNSKI